MAWVWNWNLFGTQSHRTDSRIDALTFLVKRKLCGRSNTITSRVEPIDVDQLPLNFRQGLTSNFHFQQWKLPKIRKLGGTLRSRLLEFVNLRQVIGSNRGKEFVQVTTHLISSHPSHSPVGAILARFSDESGSVIFRAAGQRAARSRSRVFVTTLSPGARG